MQKRTFHTNLSNFRFPHLPSASQQKNKPNYVPLQVVSASVFYSYHILLLLLLLKIVIHDNINNNKYVLHCLAL